MSRGSNRVSRDCANTIQREKCESTKKYEVQKAAEFFPAHTPLCVAERAQTDGLNSAGYSVMTSKLPWLVEGVQVAISRQRASAIYSPGVVAFRCDS